MNIIFALLAFLPFFFAVTTFAAAKKNGKAGAALSAVFAIVILALAAVASIFGGETLKIPAMGLSFTMDGFRAIYAVVIAFMWAGAALLSPEYFSHHGQSPRFYFFLHATLGATMGVFLSADLYTTFLFFEIMSLTSYAWVVEEETVGALKAGKTYLTIAVTGGLVTLMGLFILNARLGTLEMSVLADAAASYENKTELFICALCLFFGFAAKAGLFPVHIWLPKAHPVAPAPASALLSGVLTKAGLFGVIMITASIMAGNHAWGYLLLILGAITMVLGALLALFGTNLKYILACSSLSQIGFITVGISMLCLLSHENALAGRGVVLYMMNHSLVKLILFLSAGIIYMKAHSLDLNELRGYGRGKKILTVCFAVGGASLAGIPGTLGYSAKTLVHEAIVEYAHHGGAFITVIEWMFLFSGGITLAYVLKIFIKLFVEKPEKKTEGRYMNLPSALSIAAAPVAVVAIGVLPNLLGDRLGDMAASFTGAHAAEHAVHYFNFTNLKGIMISATIGLIIYFAVVRLLLTKDGKYTSARLGVSLEENVYVPFFKGVSTVLTLVSRIVCDLPGALMLGFKKIFLRPERDKFESRHALLIHMGDVWDKWHGRSEHKTAQKLVSAYETVFETTDRIISNLSFALITTCMGIAVILVTLLIVLAM